MVSTVTRSALLGAAIGARSIGRQRAERSGARGSSGRNWRNMVGLAAVALTTPAGARSGWVGWLGSRWGRGLITAAAVGEVLADKSPRLPSRVAPPVLAQRLAASALGAAALARRRGEPAMLPALVAMAAAAGASAAGVRWREYARQRGRGTGAAVVEDLVAIGLAIGACGMRSRR